MMTTAFVLYTQFRFGYDAQHNGYLFAYIGILSVVLQGGLVGMLTKRFGEKQLVVAGSLIMAIAFFLVPFVSPTTFGWLSSQFPGDVHLFGIHFGSTLGGLVALLLGIAGFAIGQSISNPALTSLGSKYSPEHEQGAGLGVLQSGASLARAVGPLLAGFLLYSATATNEIHLNDFSLFRTFWTASAIMLGAFLLSLYFVRKSSENLSFDKISG
jgi:DHA1 family tetracycline resistance protein-like MFS transporter